MTVVNAALADAMPGVEDGRTADTPGQSEAPPRILRRARTESGAALRSAPACGPSVLPLESSAMSLTVCLLTRNEEQTVARAIQSVRDVAEEVLVADTASVDRTAEVA